MGEGYAPPPTSFYPSVLEPDEKAYEGLTRWWQGYGPSSQISFLSAEPIPQ